jgi:amino acid transporter
VVDPDEAVVLDSASVEAIVYHHQEGDATLGEAAGCGLERRCIPVQSPHHDSAMTPDRPASRGMQSKQQRGPKRLPESRINVDGLASITEGGAMSINPVTDNAVQANSSSSRTHLAVGLRRNYLSLFEVIALAVGVIAPSVMPVLALPSEFGMAGFGSWFSYVIATVALVLVSFNINEFARREASPGSLYVVAAKGLGPIWGVISGWSLLIGYVFTGSSVVSGAANYLLVFFDQPAIDVGGMPTAVFFSVCVVGIAWYLAYRDIKLSTRATLGIECATVVLILLIVGAALWSRGHAVDVQQLQLRGSTSAGVRVGLVLAFFSFVGFEAATVVGTETREPFVTIPRAVLLSVILSGIFFSIIAYGIVSAFNGLSPTLDRSNAPLNQIALSIGMGWLGKFIAAGVAMSCFACIIACINAGARVLYALSRHGLAHASTGRAHASHATPHAAVSMVSVLIVVFSLTLTVAKTNLVSAFGYFGTLASFGFLVVYTLVAIGTPVYLRRIGALRLRHLLVSVASVLLIFVAIEGSVYPAPEWPESIIPYLFIGLVMAGVAYFLFLRWRAPQELLAIEADLLAKE